MNKKTLFYLLALCILTACSPRPPVPETASAQASETPTLTLTSTSTPEPNWETITGNLATDPSWISEEVRQGFDISLADGTLVVAAPEEAYANPINTAGPHLELSAGDFGVAFDLEAATAEFAGLSLYGALAQGEWWQGITRLDIGIKNGKVAAGYWNGSSPTPVVWQEFSAPGIFTNKRISLGMRKLGDDFLILVKGREIGRLSDPGLFASGVVYFGLNVFPKNRLILYSLSVEANHGTGVVLP